MTTNAQRGTAFERKVRADLVTRGYVVVRSTVSHTPADLVALWGRNGSHNACWHGAGDSACHPAPVVTVQAKLDGRLDHGEWNVLYRLALTSGTEALLATREREGRRLVLAYYLLTGPKVPGRRNPPMMRVIPPEVSDAEES